MYAIRSYYGHQARLAEPGLADEGDHRPGPLLERRESVAAHPLALPGKETTIRQLFDISTAAEAIPVEPALTSNYMGALRNFSRFGGGISLTSRLSVSLRYVEDGMVLVPISYNFV